MQSMQSRLLLRLRSSGISFSMAGITCTHQHMWLQVNQSLTSWLQHKPRKLQWWISFYGAIVSIIIDKNRQRQTTFLTSISQLKTGYNESILLENYSSYMLHSRTELSQSIMTVRLYENKRETHLLNYNVSMKSWWIKV